MPKGIEVGAQALAGLGKGYVEGLVLKQKMDRLKEQEKMQKQRMDAYMKHLQQVGQYQQFQMQQEQEKRSLLEGLPIEQQQQALFPSLRPEGPTRGEQLESGYSALEKRLGRPLNESEMLKYAGAEPTGMTDPEKVKTWKFYQNLSDEDKKAFMRMTGGKDPVADAEYAVGLAEELGRLTGEDPETFLKKASGQSISVQAAHREAHNQLEEIDPKFIKHDEWLSPEEMKQKVKVLAANKIKYIKEKRRPYSQERTETGEMANPTANWLRQKASLIPGVKKPNEWEYRVYPLLESMGKGWEPEPAKEVEE